MSLGKWDWRTVPFSRGTGNWGTRETGETDSFAGAAGAFPCGEGMEMPPFLYANSPGRDRGESTGRIHLKADHNGKMNQLIL